MNWRLGLQLIGLGIALSFPVIIGYILGFMDGRFSYTSAANFGSSEMCVNGYITASFIIEGGWLLLFSILFGDKVFKAEDK